MGRRWWLLLFVTACGGGSEATPDAPEPADARVPLDAGPPGPVTVTTLSRCCDGPAGVPVEGVSVTTGGVDGEVVTTDANGVATIVVEAGGSVTAVYPPVGDEPRAIVSWLAVDPGDALVFGEASPVLPPATATATITWGATTGHDSYVLRDGCVTWPVEAAATSAPISRYGATCGDPTSDVLLVAMQGGQPIRSTMLLDVAIVEGAAFEMPAFTEATTLTAGVAGLPALYTEVSVWALPDLGDVFVAGVSGSGAPTDGAFEVTDAWPAAPRIRVELWARQPDNYGAQIVSRLLDGSATSAVIDAPQFPPQITSIGYTNSNLDLALSFEGSGPYAVTVVDLAWEPMRHWRVFAPADDVVDWPVLPPQFDDVVPSASDDRHPLVSLVDIDGRSYDELRALPEAVIRGQVVTLPRNESRDY